MESIETKTRVVRKMICATKTFDEVGDCLFFQSFLRNCANDTGTIGQMDMYYGPDGVLMGIVRTNDDGLPIEVELIIP